MSRLNVAFRELVTGATLMVVDDEDRLVAPDAPEAGDRPREWGVVLWLNTDAEDGRTHQVVGLELLKIIGQAIRRPPVPSPEPTGTPTGDK